MAVGDSRIIIDAGGDLLSSFRAQVGDTAGAMGQNLKNAARAKFEKEVGNLANALKPSNMWNKFKGSITKARKDTVRGIFGGITIGALIKQSQVFTATMGSFFQVAGAMMDTILAPLAPHIAKVIGFFAREGIAIAQKFNVNGLKDFISKIPDFLIGVVKFMFPVLKAVMSIFNFVKEIISSGGGFMGMVAAFAKKLWDGVRFMGSQAMEKLIAPLWNKVTDLWTELKRKAKFDFPGMTIMGKEVTKPHTIYLFGAPRHVSSASVTQRNVQKGMANLEGVAASEVAGLDISKTASKINVPTAFHKKPKSAAEVVANLQTGAALVQDIYSGFHRGGEGSFGGSNFFSNAGKETPGLKDTVNKIIGLVSSPSQMAGELKAVLNATEAGAVTKSIAGGGGFGGAAGHYDDITRTSMSAKASGFILTGSIGSGTGNAEGGFN